MRVDLQQLRRMLEDELEALGRRQAELEQQLQHLEAVEGVARDYAAAIVDPLEQEQERRKSRRFRLSVPCQCRWGDTAVNCRALDVSLGGVRVTHPSLIPDSGRDLNLTFEADDRHSFRGRVVHQSRLADGIHFGVKFLGSDQEGDAKISRILALSLEDSEADTRD